MIPFWNLFDCSDMFKEGRKYSSSWMMIVWMWYMEKLNRINFKKKVFCTLDERLWNWNKMKVNFWYISYKNILGGSGWEHNVALTKLSSI